MRFFEDPGWDYYRPNRLANFAPILNEGRRWLKNLDYRVDPDKLVAIDGLSGHF